MPRAIRQLVQLVALLAVSVDASPQIPLQSRSVTPSSETTAEFVQELQASKDDSKHGLASFASDPTAGERAALASAGLHVLSPFYEHVYVVRVEKRADVTSLQVGGQPIQLIGLRGEDKVDQRIWRGNFRAFAVGSPRRNYVLNNDGTVNVTVRFHRDAPRAAAERTLGGRGRIRERLNDETLVVVLPREELQSLADEDIVRWIDAAPAPFLPDNSRTRRKIAVDVVQNFDVTTGQVRGVGGKGIQVGIFDSGVDALHGDYKDRVVANEDGAASHGTHVAGIVASAGNYSNRADSCGRQNSGTAFQWRGMAPQAQLIDAGSGSGSNAAKYSHFISDKGMDLSNHSYSFTFDGHYDESNRIRDELIRGDARHGGKRVPGRLQVYSAGNNGRDPQHGGAQDGYFSLTKQVKNALIVGNWNAGNDKVAQGSSLGPAYDGRIKPDVVAPGISIKSTGYGSNCQGSSNRRRHYYRYSGGTSMAAPAVAGVVALVLQQYADTYEVSVPENLPAPATLRAIIIHTATDKQAKTAYFDNDDGPVKPSLGPDFVTGWGLVNAEAAVNAVRTRYIVESSLAATCEVASFPLNVSDGATGSLRVTLAWDDFAGEPQGPRTSPRLFNDLDLVLIDPQGKTHYPWQLDQRVVDSNRQAVPDGNQKCGTKYIVEREFRPAANPSKAKDPIPAGGVPIAKRGTDRLNNVEVVDAPAMPGVWQARVTAFSLKDSPQRFSLVGVPSPK